MYEMNGSLTASSSLSPQLDSTLRRRVKGSYQSYSGLSNEDEEQDVSMLQSIDRSSLEDTWHSQSLNEDGFMSACQSTDTRYPGYCQKTRGLDVKEIIELCSKQKRKGEGICKRVPIPKSDTLYIEDLQAVNEKDLTCDDSGTYDKHSSPSALVNATVSSSGNVKIHKVISRSKRNMQERDLNKEGNYLIRRMYSEKEDRGTGRQTRIVSKVFHCGKLCRYAVVQYLGQWYANLRPHKNSRSNEPYIRTKPSTLQKEKKLAETVSPKQVINLIESETENLLTDASISDNPSNRQQIYNIRKKMDNKVKSRNTGRVQKASFEKLILSMDAGNFIKNVDFSCRKAKERIYPNTFAATTDTLNFVKSYCSPSSKHKSQLAIDMTYKVGPFYKTCLCMPHPAFVHRNDRAKHPTVFVGMMTSTGRQIEDYLYLANQLKRNGVSSLIYGTDGELALEKAIEEVYPTSESQSNIHLRCFNHVKDDLTLNLKNMQIENPEHLINEILGSEYRGIRVQGLVDSGSKEFSEKYYRMKNTWPESFIHYMESTNLRLRSLKETLHKCMGRDIRIKAGLGNPPNKYENQRAESINNILKESVGGQPVDQAAVHDLVYQNVVLPQERELIKAVYGEGEYRLAEDFKVLEIPPTRWNTMTPEQRQFHIKKILSPSLLKKDDRAIIRKLSVQPEDCRAFTDNIPPYLVNDIWEMAEQILSHGKITDVDEMNVCVIDKRESFVVHIDQQIYTCSCEVFQKVKLCAHTLVCADNRSSVIELLSNRAYDLSAAVLRLQSPSAGEKRAKKPRRGKQNIVKRPILTEIPAPASYASGIDLNQRRPFQFTEIWHNDEPFIIEAVKDQNTGKAVNCCSCSCLMSSNTALPPYDILLSHKERYLYPCMDSEGKKTMKPTFKQLAKRYYCIKRFCVLNRHPYFWTGLVKTGSVTLAESHKHLLKDVFDLDLN